MIDCLIVLARKLFGFYENSIYYTVANNFKELFQTPGIRSLLFT
jgi:hypothetical protein